MRPAYVLSTAVLGEVQGLYGAYSFPEKLLQKIWLRGDFDRASAVTSDNRKVRILHPGKWNLLGGPDFIGARLRFGETATNDILGDVEVHLRAGDWDAHGHARDPAYDRVMLHVVLFPPDLDYVTRGADGGAIPMLALLPLLHRALEEFAADEAVESLANRPISRLPDELGTLQPNELAALLRRYASARWKQKIHFAGLRIQRLGWEGACHCTALEILGYRFNRTPMLRVAARWPLAKWADTMVNSDEVFEAECDTWSLQGVRPANHPRTRLRQYARWTSACPDWPTRVRELERALPLFEETSTHDARRRFRFGQLRDRIAAEVCANQIGGTRLGNLVCDGLLPLLSAATERNFELVWYHWFIGDLPPLLTSGLRQLGFFDGRVQPACHGAGQGLLGWILERDSRR